MILYFIPYILVWKNVHQGVTQQTLAPNDTNSSDWFCLLLCLSSLPGPLPEVGVGRENPAVASCSSTMIIFSSNGTGGRGARLLIPFSASKRRIRELWTGSVGGGLEGTSGSCRAQGTPCSFTALRTRLLLEVGVLISLDKLLLSWTERLWIVLLWMGSIQ